MRRREFLRCAGWRGTRMAALGARAAGRADAGASDISEGVTTPQMGSERTLLFVQRLTRTRLGSRGATRQLRFGGRRDVASAIPRIAAEFVRLKVDVIVTAGRWQPSSKNRQRQSIPIVFAVGERSSWNRSSRKVWRDRGEPSPACLLQFSRHCRQVLEFLRETVPWGLRRWGIMANIDYPGAVLEFGECSRALGPAPRPRNLPVSKSSDRTISHFVFKTLKSPAP